MLKDRVGEIKCGWCGAAMCVLEGYEARSVRCVWGDMNGTLEEYELVFCCEGCHWAYQMDQHQLMGMRGKEARKHITEEHGGISGAPAGSQCREAYERSARFGEHLLSMITRGQDGLFGVGSS